ncbi:tyrosine-type recombinase/integrase [Acetobacterium wieringae]|uniref:tyrosine-type recombinase/integrase n=1 Tax=Acetobacterium wieringae TaxID=52694 RepID=UPI0026EC37A1|nr:tyrosine-type recombinase/integrase [Acetobacterium wieringae]
MAKNGQSINSMNITGIEWTLDRDFHFGIENAKYMEALIDEIKILPTKRGNIEFSSNVWDFSHCQEHKSKLNVVFNFNSIPTVFIQQMKMFVLLSTINCSYSKNKISTICNEFQRIKNYLKFLQKNGINSISSSNDQIIDSYIETKASLSTRSLEGLYTCLIHFYEFFIINYNYTINVDIVKLKEIKVLHQVVNQQTKENNKTPDIPKDFYNKVVALMISTMRDPSQNYKNRSAVCAYLIISQTGLRITEIQTLETDSLKCLTLPNLNCNAYFLTYKNFKSGNAFKDFINVDIFANELTKEAFETLLEMRESRPNKDGNSYIYLPDVKHLPAAPYTLNRAFHSFLNKKADFANPDFFSYPGLHSVKVTKEKLVISPTVKQFRVHVCTTLYERNVPLQYIQKFMGHLSKEMMGYYVRPKNQKQEDAEFSNKLLNDLIHNQASLIGTYASDIHKNIDDFIKTKKLNIATDLEEIIEQLNGQFIIRAKRGGVCIKTSIRDCAKDARTNEMFCAFNVCPNLFHLYYMVDISYSDFQKTKQTFQYNAAHGYKLQALKELNNSKAICTKRLIPEMQDLRNRIDLLGVENILQTYPNLSEIIFNYDTILEEVEKWSKITF